MSRWGDKLRDFNAEWNDLPRRLAYIVLLLACLFAVIWVFPYVAPFVLAAVFAWIIEPVVRFVSRRFSDRKLVRGIAAGIMVVLLASLVSALLFLLVTRVLDEIGALASALPGWVATASEQLIAWIENLDLDWPVLQDGVEDALLRLLSEATSTLTSLASRLASLVARAAWRTASLLPEAVLFVVFTLMGTFYMSADPQRIFSFLRSLLPEKYRQRSIVYKASILRAVLGQLRAALILLMVTAAELVCGFLLMGMDYAVLLALFIAVLDALPVIGAGLFLIPMMLYGIIVGDAGMAVGFGLIYLMTIVVRQLLEPRLIGRQLGLYPLATMMAMYAGLQAMGFLGMLLGPLMLLLCKVALTADVNKAADMARRPPIRWPWKQKRTQPPDPPAQSPPGESAGDEPAGPDTACKEGNNDAC